MAETDVVVVLASVLSCHIGRHSPDNSRTGLNNSIFCIPLGVRQPVTPGQCQQSQCRSTLIDDYLLQPRMSIQGHFETKRPCRARVLCWSLAPLAADTRPECGSLKPSLSSGRLHLLSLVRSTRALQD